MTKNRIKFVIVGCGRIGKRHAVHASSIGELVAVCDVLMDRADELAKNFNCSSYYSLSELLANEIDFDVVAICTPNNLHASQTVVALNAGFNVLCEKPMAICSIEAREMIATAQRVQKELFIVKQNRFNPPVVAIKKIIEEGRLGKIFSFQINCFWNRNQDYYKDSWHGDLNIDGGTLFTQFSHFIDLLYWLIGDVEDVRAFSNNFAHSDSMEFEDTGVVILKMKNGAIGTLNFTVNSFLQNMEGSISIFAEKGTVKIGGKYLNELEYQQLKDFKITNLKKGNPANEYGFYQGSMSNHDLVYKNVVDVLLKNDKISTTGFEGLKTVEIIEKIHDCFRV